MVLASGHLHVSETWVVFEEAQRRGVKRLVFTHPEDIVDATLNDVKGIAAMGAFVEHSLCMFLEGCKFRSREPEDLRHQIEAAGVEQDDSLLGSRPGRHLQPARWLPPRDQDAAWILATMTNRSVRWFPPIRRLRSAIEADLVAARAAEPTRYQYASRPRGWPVT